MTRIPRHSEFECTLIRKELQLRKDQDAYEERLIECITLRSAMEILALSEENTLVHTESEEGP